MKTESDFNKMIKGKNLLYIPIVSSINRETNLYNLGTDGNINRMITTFIRNNSFDKLTVVLPKNSTNHDFINSFIELSNNKIEIIYSDFFGIHAGEQRSNMFIITNIINELQSVTDGLDTFDFVIGDSQYLLWYLANYNIVDNEKLIFWNYLCSTKEYQRSFTSSLVDITEEIINIVGNVIVTSPNIAKYVEEIKKSSKNIIYIPRFVDRDIYIFGKYDNDLVIDEILNEFKSEKTIPIYLPFRLTDEAYKIDLVVEFINNYNKEAEKNNYKIVLLYSDPNNSGEMDKIIDKYEILQNKNISKYQVSNSRDTFYTIIDHPIGVNIPYFEDLDFANHAAIWEFKDSNANIWVLDKYDGKNMPYYEESDLKLFKTYKMFDKKYHDRFKVYF